MEEELEVNYYTGEYWGYYFTAFVTRAQLVVEFDWKWEDYYIK